MATEQVHPESEGWLDLYCFTPEPQYAVDYEVANRFTATHPGSIFVPTLLVQKPTADARYFLRNRELIVDRGGPPLVEVLSDDGERRKALGDSFGLDVPVEVVPVALQKVQPLA